MGFIEDKARLMCWMGESLEKPNWLGSVFLGSSLRYLEVKPSDFSGEYVAVVPLKSDSMGLCKSGVRGRGERELKQMGPLFPAM